MSRILITSWGSFGDVYPYVGLALALKTRGHRPVIAMPEFYHALIETLGFEFRAVGPMIDPDDRDTIARVMDPIRGADASSHQSQHDHAHHRPNHAESHAHLTLSVTRAARPTFPFASVVTGCYRSRAVPGSHPFRAMRDRRRRANAPSPVSPREPPLKPPPLVLPPTRKPSSPALSAATLLDRPAGARAGLAGARVLIVEDDQDCRELICTFLERAGAKVLGVDSVAAAMDSVYRSFDPDVVLTDYSMPIANGLELIRQFRKAPERIDQILAKSNRMR